MVSYIPLNKAEHASARWRRPANFEFAAKDLIAPVVAIEAAQAAVNMPLAFARVDNLVQLVALLSVDGAKNVFVGSDSNWLGAYVPAYFRSFPFRLARVEGRDDFAVCVAGEGYLGDVGEPVYDGNGELTGPTREIVGFLDAYERSRQQTLFASAALSETGVLAPWPIKVREASGKESTIGGMFRVDEPALANLTDEAFLRLRKVGALGIAYAQLMSMSRLEVLSRMSAFSGRPSQGQRKPELNLDFLREDDGDLVF